MLLPQNYNTLYGGISMGVRKNIKYGTRSLSSQFLGIHNALRSPSPSRTTLLTLKMLVLIDYRNALKSFRVSISTFNEMETNSPGLQESFLPSRHEFILYKIQLHNSELTFSCHSTEVISLDGLLSQFVPSHRT